MAYDVSGETVAIREFIFKRLQVHTSTVFSQYEYETAVDRIEMAERLDSTFRGAIFDLYMKCAGDQVETDVQYVKWPKTWWDAVKSRWFSDWMIERWPVRYEERKFVTQTIMRMCPHLGLNPKEKHIRWLIREQPSYKIVKDGTV